MNNNRLQALLDFFDMKPIELAKTMGWSKSSISMYLSGKREMRSDKIGQLYDKFGVDPKWMMGYDVPMFQEKKETVTAEQVFVPLYGKVSAGFGTIAYESVEDYISVPNHVASADDCYALKISGDSMSPRMLDGDIIIVHRQNFADDGDIVVALIDGEEAVCKKLKLFDDGIMLISNNSAYPPMIFVRKEIESLPVRIIGKVIELRAKM